MEILQEYMEDEDVETIIEKFHAEMEEAERLEFVVVLEKMLWFGPSNAMKRFVKLLLERGESISPVIRCRMAEHVYEADDPLYIEKIRMWITSPEMDVACRIEWIHKISGYPTYEIEQQLEDWIDHLFHHPSIEKNAAYRYRILMDAGTTYENDNGAFVALLRRYRGIFSDPIMYKIMLVHYLLKRDLVNPFEDDFMEECLNELYFILKNRTTTTFEIQADIADFFLNTEYKRISSMYREEAQRVMIELFQENMTSQLSLFSNRQNVHSESIESSSQDILEQLHARYGHVQHDLYHVQYWRTEIEEWRVFKDMDQTEQDKIIVAMNRICFDKRIYGKTGDTLAGILALVWRHIHQSDHKDELKKRLLEELIEASGQCSTGFAVRILNTLSGFDDFMLKISYREAILSKVIHHLNSIIMRMEDPDLQAILLEEMTNTSYGERKHFLDLFRREVPSLKESLYSEFKEHISDTDFDLYLRTALLHYENA